MATSDLLFEFLDTVDTIFRLVRVEECCEADFIPQRVGATGEDVPHLLTRRRIVRACKFRFVIFMKVRVPFSPSKSLAAELEAYTAVMIRSANIGVNIPSGARRVMLISHAADVEASTAECTACKSVL